MKCSLNFEAKAFYTSVVSIVFDGTKGGECLTGAEGSKQFADTLSQMEGLEAGCYVGNHHYFIYLPTNVSK